MMAAMTNEATIQDVMAQMPYGLYIVGSHRGDDVDGMMADWVMQVSFSPRLVAVALENDARTLENLRSNRVFSMNLLSAESSSMALAAKFAQPYYDAKVGGRASSPVRVHHKLDGIAYTRSPGGCPVLDDAIAWLECEAREFVPTGDHTLVIAHVRAGGRQGEGEPLTSTYTGWNYSG
jgi:flavin reductase (DIM6/NTAB) family NADH-FMN oxidoreductase RutF